MSAAKNLLAVGFAYLRWSRCPLSEPSNARRGVRNAFDGITRQVHKNPCLLVSYMPLEPSGDRFFGSSVRGACGRGAHRLQRQRHSFPLQRRPVLPVIVPRDSTLVMVVNIGHHPTRSEAAPISVGKSSFRLGFGIGGGVIFA